MNNFGPIKVLLVPHGCKEIQYDSDATKQSYFYKGFVKTTVTCNTQDKINNLPQNIQGQRKQYGIQHYVAVTIHSAMGDTLPSVATSLSMDYDNHSMWDKGQILVILSRKKLSKDTIFAGKKKYFK